VQTPAAPLTPTAVQIDASAHCQLVCPLCPTAHARTRPGLGQGHLKLGDFQTLLDQNPTITHVELSNYGEMFLNPQLPQILACAYHRNVSVSGGNGVNLNHASESALEAVVKYRVRTLTCSLDGATPETYAKYRINGNLERVLGNIDKIREYRRVYRSAFPLLDWQFVVFGHNEHELPVARAMAAQRGMGFLPRLSWNDDHSPVQNRELVRLGTGLGAASRDEFKEKRGHGYARDICFQLWRQPVLNWDGRMMGCCVNYWQDFGTNAFAEGLTASTRHPNMNYAREMLLGRAAPRLEIPCTRCYHFEEIQESGDWLTEDEIASASAPNMVGAILLEGPSELKFAQASVVEGAGSPPAYETPGRLFRFGTDTAIYFAPRSARPHTVFVRMLGGAGWSETKISRLEVRERPLCQQWHVDLAQPAAFGPARSEPGRVMPAWIR